MAHNIEIRNNVASFAENQKQKKAWHDLAGDGQIFDGAISVEDALHASHADYRVELRPLIPVISDMSRYEGLSLEGEEVESLMLPSHMVTMRMDTHEVLGVVSDSYGIVQNNDALKFINDLCSGGTGAPTIEACGVLGHGERVFITCKFPEDIILNAKMDDRIERYLIFTTSHDGTGAVKCVCTPVRVVCQNTLNLALRNNSGSFSMRHTANIMSRLDLLNGENAKFAYKSLNMEREYNEYFKAELERLRCLEITKKQVNDIIAQVVLPEDNLKVYRATHNIEHEDISTRSRNLYNAMLTAVHEGVGQEYLESGNALWLLDGITTYYQNNAKYKNNEVKFMSIMGGYVSRKVQKAYELCLEVA
jgi:phage/plasmid-like protein (TIGR03299 family)